MNPTDRTKTTPETPETSDATEPRQAPVTPEPPDAVAGTWLRADAWTEANGWRTINVSVSGPEAARLRAMTRLRLERDPAVLGLLTQSLGTDMIDLRNVELVGAPTPG